MKRWLWSQSLQRKTILGMVLVGLLPLALSLFLTYVEERRALREITGSNFKGIAVEVARKIETQIMRGINEAQQLATIPFIRAAVKEANRSYEGRESEKIKAFIEEWKERWRARKNPHEFPAFVNRIATNYLVDWHARSQVGLPGHSGDRQSGCIGSQFLASSTLLPRGYGMVGGRVSAGPRSDLREGFDLRSLIWNPRPERRRSYI